MNQREDDGIATWGESLVFVWKVTSLEICVSDFFSRLQRWSKVVSRNPLENLFYFFSFQGCCRLSRDVPFHRFYLLLIFALHSNSPWTIIISIWIFFFYGYLISHTFIASWPGYIPSWYPWYDFFQGVNWYAECADIISVKMRYKQQLHSYSLWKSPPPFFWLSHWSPSILVIHLLLMYVQTFREFSVIKASFFIYVNYIATHMLIIRNELPEAMFSQHTHENHADRGDVNGYFSICSDFLSVKSGWINRSGFNRNAQNGFLFYNLTRSRKCSAFLVDYICSGNCSNYSLHILMGSFSHVYRSTIYYREPSYPSGTDFQSQHIEYWEKTNPWLIR